MGNLGWSVFDVAELVVPQFAVAISPDGSRIVYSSRTDGGRQLYLRVFDHFEPRPLPDTENGVAPFFSPDGKSIGFFADGKLKRVSLAGGVPLVLCDAPSARGGTWLADGTIIFTPTDGGGLWRVSADAGTRQNLETQDASAGEVENYLPSALPDGKSVLYTAWMGGTASRSGVYSLDTGERKILLEDANPAYYLPPGYLVFGRGGEIWAVAFDLQRLDVIGSPTKLVDGVWQGGFYSSTMFTVSPSGVLAYVAQGAERKRKSLVWVDRKGNESPLTTISRAYAAPRLSPDGMRLLVRIDEGRSDIWSYEIERGMLTRLTSDDYSEGPQWAADGKAFFYSSNVAGMPNSHLKPALPGGASERLFASKHPQYVESVSKDGRFVGVLEQNPETSLDTYFLPLHGERAPIPFLASPAREYLSDISPDGQWVAYVSNESGQAEVYVRPFPPRDGRWQLSVNGGTEPRWSPDGRQVFYRDARKMMVVDAQMNPDVAFSSPRLLFEGPYEVMDGPLNYDITADGRRFIMVKPEKPESFGSLRVVTNWGWEVRTALPKTP